MLLDFSDHTRTGISKLISRPSFWVKAHIGTKGNKAADEAAKIGAENKDNKLQVIKTPMPGAVTKTEIDNAIRKEWKRKWQSAPHYKQSISIVAWIKTKQRKY